MAIAELASAVADTFEVLISNPHSSIRCVIGGASGTAICDGDVVASLTVRVEAGPTLEPNGRGCGSKWMATAHGQVP